MQKFIFYFFLLSVAMIYASCSNDINEVKLINADKETPDESMKKVTMIYTDSGIQRAILNTPVIFKYGTAQTRTEFPNGLIVDFFDKKGKKESYLSAGYGILNEKNNQLILQKNVMMIHFGRNDTLLTDYMIWKQDSAIIATEDTVRIWGQTGRFSGDHFRAKENFTRYTWKNVKGDYFYKATDTL